VGGQLRCGRTEVDYISPPAGAYPELMPRYDGNTNERKSRHHKAMKSSSGGMGHSAKVRLLKQENGRRAKVAKPDKRERDRSRDD